MPRTVIIKPTPELIRQIGKREANNAAKIGEAILNHLDLPCHRCGLKIGLGPDNCTGWHPDFKCICGYEKAGGEIPASCPYCGGENLIK